jgi:hypothetical protein
MNDKWDWLPRDENGNPIFYDFDIIMEVWMVDQITWDPRDHRPETPQSPPMTALNWLAWVAVGLIVGVGILLNL